MAAFVTSSSCSRHHQTSERLRSSPFASFFSVPLLPGTDFGARGPRPSEF